jgi:bacterioferritin (cytochrome b1)
MSDLILELQNLIRLTQSEAMIARARRSQAANQTIERELAQNAADADDRAVELAETLRSLGGVPDVVGQGLNRLATTTRLQLEQVAPPREALLSDLRLERELQDRARFARALAQTDGATSVVRLLERVERSHGETIEWIEQRLGELAIGGPVAIRPTPTQVAAQWSQRLALLPTRAMSAGLNRAAHQLRRAQRKTSRVADEGVGRAMVVAGGATERGAAPEGAAAARDASLHRAEEQARGKGYDNTADRVHQLRTSVAPPEPDELRIEDYDQLTVVEISAQLGEVSDPDDVRAVLIYEQANQARKGVLTAAEARLEELGAAAIAG